jgi:hypothetical protein
MKFTKENFYRDNAAFTVKYHLPIVDFFKNRSLYSRTCLSALNDMGEKIGESTPFNFRTI